MIEEMIDEIDFVAYHRKADMSTVDRIIVNGKVYLSVDKVLEIIGKDKGGYGACLMIRSEIEAYEGYN